MTTITPSSLLRWPGRAVGACLIGAIRLYQVTLSPLLGPACRFEPSCSRYMVESIKKYGPGKGSAAAYAGCRAATPGTPGATTRRDENCIAGWQTGLTGNKH